MSFKLSESGLARTQVRLHVVSDLRVLLRDLWQPPDSRTYKYVYIICRNPRDFWERNFTIRLFSLFGILISLEYLRFIILILPSVDKRVDMCSNIIFLMFWVIKKPGRIVEYLSILLLHYIAFELNV